MIDHAIIFFVFLYGLRTREDVLLIIKTLLACVAIANLATIASVAGVASIGEVEFEGERVLGAFGHANETGPLLAAFIPIYVACIVSSRGLARTFWVSRSAPVSPS